MEKTFSESDSIQEYGVQTYHMVVLILGFLQAANIELAGAVSALVKTDIDQLSLDDLKRHSQQARRATMLLMSELMRCDDLLETIVKDAEEHLGSPEGE